jgi:hypothetical protein
MIREARARVFAVRQPALLQSVSMKLFNAPPVAIGLLASLTLAACSSAGGKTSESNPVPALTSVSPSSIQAGSPTTTISATGSNFLPSSTVMWNGSALPTSYTSSTTITAQVSAADLQAEGSATVKVVNPPPGGGWSEGLTLLTQAARATQPARPVYALRRGDPSSPEGRLCRP